MDRAQITVITDAETLPKLAEQCGAIDERDPIIMECGPVIARH